MTGIQIVRRMVIPTLAMCLIVVASNILVQYPFTPLGLANWFTWGAFSYPVAFLVTDMANGRFGVRLARMVVGAGLVCAVI